MTYIQDQIDACANAYGKAYIPASANLTLDAVDALQRLADALGVEYTFKLAQSDLISLYAVARKSEATARRMADKLNKRDGAPSPTPAPEVMPNDDDIADKLEYIHLRIDRADSSAVAAGDVARAALETAREQRGSIDALRVSIEALEPDSDKLAAMVREAVVANTPTRVVVTMPDRHDADLGLAHEQTPKLIRAMSGKDISVYLHGPAGTGKTSAAKQVAKTFGLPFYFAARVESEYLLFGFRDANGNTVRTQFREAYEHGGLFLFDEMDASASSAIVAINAALANGVATFPDGTVGRHPDFKCIGAGNTTLNGASHQYTGRTALDAASIDRFVFMHFGYDEKLERAVATNSAWCDHVQAVRAQVALRGLDHLVTPRATIYGGTLLDDCGMTWKEAEEMAIFKGLDAATVAQLRDAAGDMILSNAA